MDTHKQLFALSKENYTYTLKCMFHAYGGKNIYPGQPAILKIIAQKLSCSQSEIAKELGVSSASIGMSLRRLEKAGYIDRTVDPEDLRSKKISLTPAGRAVCREATEDEDRMAECWRDGFSDEELYQLAGLLARVNDNLRNYYEQLQQKEQQAN